MIFDRYFLREFWGPFCFSLALLGALMSTGFVLFHLMEEMVQFDIPLLMVLKIFLLRLPEMLFYTLPMALLLGSMLAFSRLSHDNEILAFYSFGGTPAHLFRGAIGFALGIVCLTFLANETLIPPSVFAARQAMHLAQTGNPLLQIKKNFTYRFVDSQGDTYVFYAAHAEINKLRLVSVQQLSPQGEVLFFLKAKEALLKRGDWLFKEGEMIRFQDKYQSEFKTFQLPIRPQFNSLMGVKKPLEMNMSELSQYIEGLKKGGKQAHALNVRWYHKLTIPMAGVLFTCLGVLLGTHVNPGQSQSFGLSLGCIFIYYLLMAIGTALGDSGVIHAGVGAGLPHFILWPGVALWGQMAHKV